MAKPLKLILALFGTLILLLAAAIVALPFLFDPNDFRGKLSEAVKKETGREFTVGEIRLSVFPWLRVEIDQATLGNAPGFGANPMLQVQKADVGVKLMPLLREKRVEASEVKLSGVRATLSVKGDGVSNWADLQAWQQKRAEEAGPDEGGTALADLDIAGIELEDVSLTYADAQAGSDYAVEKLRLKTGRLHGGEPFPVEGGLRLLSGSAKAQADLDFSTTVAYEAASGSVQLEALELTLAGEKAGVMPAQSLAAKLKLKTPLLKYDGAAKTVDSGALVVDIDGLRSGTEDKPKLLAKGSVAVRAQSDLGKRRHQLQGIDLALDLGGSSLPGGKAQPLKLQGGLEADLTADSARISALKLDFAGLKLASNQLLIERLMSELPEVAGDLSVAPFSPRTLMTTLGIAVPTTADAEVLSTASLNSQLAATSRSLALKGLTLKLDDTTLRGDFAVRDLATQALAFNLKGDSLDADRYLTPKAAPAEAAKPATPADKAALNATELPVKALDKLNADGTLELAKLKVQGVALSDVRLRLASPGNGIKRQQLSAGLYGGRADIALDVSNPASKPGYALKTALTGINAGPLLKDFMGKDTLSGKGSVNLDLRSSGLTVGEVRKALNGDVAFNFVDGAVKGFNLGKIIRDGQNLLAVGQGGAATASASEPQATDFAELRGAGKFVNGVLKSDQLSAKNPLIRLEGAGEVDLVGETINYLAKPTLVGTAKGQGGRELADLAGVTIPIRLSGNMYAPKVSIDWKTALSQKATEQLRGKLGTALGLQPDALTKEGGQEALKQKAAEELNKGLLKLFGGKKKAAEPAPETAPAETESQPQP